MAPTKPTYFDYYQSTADNEPLSFPAGMNTLADVHAYRPMPAVADA
jgi:hypothetical protein